MKPEWWFIVGIFALGGVFWLASMYNAVFRILMFSWGLVLGIGGIGAIFGAVDMLSERVSSLFDIFMAIVGLVFVTGLGLYMLHSAYSLICIAISREEWEE